MARIRKTLPEGETKTVPAAPPMNPVKAMQGVMDAVADFAQKAKPLVGEIHFATAAGPGARMNSAPLCGVGTKDKVVTEIVAILDDPRVCGACLGARLKGNTYVAVLVAPRRQLQ